MSHIVLLLFLFYFLCFFEVKVGCLLWVWVINMKAISKHFSLNPYSDHISWTFKRGCFPSLPHKRIAYIGPSSDRSSPLWCKTRSSGPNLINSEMWRLQIDDPRTLDKIWYFSMIWLLWCTQMCKCLHYLLWKRFSKKNIYIYIYIIIENLANKWW